MTYSVADAIGVIEAAFPLEWQDDWDNSGLIVGDKTAPLRGVLLSLDVTEAVVDEAIERDCNLIIAHHPILFRGLKRLTGQTEEQRVVAKAIKHDISIFAAHTCMDKSPRGTSARLAQMLGLTDVHILKCEREVQNGDEIVPVGYGVVGKLPHKMSSTEFLDHLKEKLQLNCVRHSDVVDVVERVAICTGSGSEFISTAKASGAQAYVTADIKYHQFQQVEGAMMIADIGHFESEVICKEIFSELLTEKLHTFAPSLSATSLNPIKYH